MQLNRVFGRIRLVRPCRVQLSTAAWTQSQFHMHRRWINTRQPKQPSDQVPNRIESKLDKVLGDKSAEASRATGDQFSENKGPFSSSYSTPSSLSSSSSSSDANRSSSSSSSSGFMGSSSERASTYDRFGSDRLEEVTAAKDNFASEEGSTAGRSSSYSSSSDGFLGSRAAESGYTEGRSKTGGGSFGDTVNKMANKISDKFSSGSGSLSEMANKVADKVSEKFSDSDRSSDRSSDKSSDISSSGLSDNQYSRDNNQYSRDYNQSSSSSTDYNRSSNDYNRASDDRYSGIERSPSSSGDRSYDNRYSGDRSYEGGSSSRSGSGSSSSTGTLGQAFNKMSDKISEGSSTIGQTLHKISDKISETFSGSDQSGNRSSEGDSYSQGKMTRTRRNNRRDSSSLNPFDLSSFFRSNFFDNLSETFSGQALAMKTDIIERDAEYRVICDLPGVDKKDINISLRKNYLEIYGDRSEGYDQEGSDQTVHCQERYFGSFTRRLSLPEDAAKDMSRIKAKCENGVLTVTIPKSQQSSSRDRYNINIE